MLSPRLAPLLLIWPLLSGAAEPVSVPSSAAIPEETLQSLRLGKRVISFWWLPVEYWVAAARELKESGESIDRVRRLLRDYVILGIVDANVRRDGQLDFASLGDANQRLALVRNGKSAGPVSRLDPEVGRMLPELSYFMTASLGVLGPGLRLVLFPNIDAKGRPILTGSQKGELQARYQPEGEEPVSLVWRAPLTSVVGPRKCPRGSEEVEASWTYCPWHGVRLD